MDIEIKPTTKNFHKKAIIIAVVIVIIIVAGYVGYIEYKKIHANDLLKQEYQQKLAILQSLNDYYNAHPISQAQKEAEMQAFLKSHPAPPATTSTKSKVPAQLTPEQKLKLFQ